MRGTITFELELLLDLEMDFNFIPGDPGKLDGHPDFRYPPTDPEYEILEIRCRHSKQWHKLPDWFRDILVFDYQDSLIEAADEWLKLP